MENVTAEIKTAEEVIDMVNKHKDDVEAIEALAAVGWMSALRSSKTGNLLHDNKNLIGGLIGCAIATGLEVLSPTGSKTSAAVAATTSGLTLYTVHKLLDAAPQTNVIAGSACAVTAYVGMATGRLAACYFPGTVDLDDL